MRDGLLFSQAARTSTISRLKQRVAEKCATAHRPWADARAIIFQKDPSSSGHRGFRPTQNPKNDRFRAWPLRTHCTATDRTAALALGTWLLRANRLPRIGRVQPFGERRVLVDFVQRSGRNVVHLATPCAHLLATTGFASVSDLAQFSAGAGRAAHPARRGLIVRRIPAAGERGVG